MRVATYRATGHEPEQESDDYMMRWLNKNGLEFGENGVQNFGFDVNTHGESDYEKGIRCYQKFATVPKGIEGSEGVETKQHCL